MIRLLHRHDWRGAYDGDGWRCAKCDEWKPPTPTARERLLICSRTAQAASVACEQRNEGENAAFWRGRARAFYEAAEIVGSP